MPGPSPENASLLQLAQTPVPRTSRKTRAHADFLYQGSGHSASFEPSKDSSESLEHPRPRGGREVADISGLLCTSMLPTLSTIPSVTLSTILLSQPALVGTPPLSSHPAKTDILSQPNPPSSSPLAPNSPHTITYSKPTEQSTKVSPFPPPKSSSQFFCQSKHS